MKVRKSPNLPPSSRAKLGGSNVEPKRIDQQIAFLKEMDRLKSIQRKSFVSGARRPETTAEHSWHVALMGLVLAEHALPPGVNAQRVMNMLLVHDIVEIDAGDTLLYASAEAHAAQRERELTAAQRLFSLLPSPDGEQLRALWAEFEARESADAKFAAAIDRLQPLLLNFMSEGTTWQRHGITAQQVLEKNQVIREGSAVLWEVARELIEEAVRRGYLKHET